MCNETLSLATDVSVAYTLTFPARFIPPRITFLETKKRQVRLYK